MNEFLEYWKAITFCFERHINQMRKSSKIPYAVHPIRVAAILRSAGYTESENEKMLISALLHDLVEDTDTTFDDINSIFGEKITSIVRELTKPKKRNKEEWLKNFRVASIEAKIIKMADRIDNLLDMNIDFWSVEKQREYANQAKLILEICGNADLNLANKLEAIIEKILTSR